MDAEEERAPPLAAPKPIRMASAYQNGKFSPAAAAAHPPPITVDISPHPGLEAPSPGTYSGRYSSLTNTPVSANSSSVDTTEMRF